jgi:hypothetical protein
MGRRGSGYGSEDHLRVYLSHRRELLNHAVGAALDIDPASLSWLAYPPTKTGDREFRGLEFVKGTPDEQVLRAWKEYWPRTGRAQTWDAVGRAGDTWILVEAKANWPEFVSSPTGATGESLKQISSRLGRLRRELGVHRFFDWTSVYYQHTNRLAALAFLLKQGVDARLVGVYFYGDRFPDDTPCPASKEDWEGLIEARRLTLGLPKQHALSRFEAEVFLPAIAQLGSDRRAVG